MKRKSMISNKMSGKRKKPTCAKNPLTKTLTLTEIRKEVEQVVSSEENDTVKFDRLKQVEEEQYKSLIHQLVYKETLEELKDLVIVLKDLGYLTTKLGELSGELKYYTEAAIFYQYVITILEVDNKLNDESFIKQELTNSYQQLTNIQRLIYLTAGANQEKMPVVQKEATSNKELLLALRKKTDQEMQEIESYYQKSKTGNQEEKQKSQELYVNTARELFKKIADEMKDFLSKLYKTAEADLGKPPCKYAVIGLGSMALNQITPYSDLEFAILTENEDYKHSLNTKLMEYFKNLSHFVNFKMINLGESTIPTSKYDLDMSRLVRVAVNFDLGGKTPLGRIGGGKPYELIKTVDWMLQYVRNEGDKTSHIDKSLPYILENVCHVYGDEELVKTYEDKVTEFLHSEIEDKQHGKLKNCEIRAIKLLIEGAVEIAYLQGLSDLKPEKKLFQSDLEKLEPTLFDYQGRLFDVKQEIYRLPDRMVYNLGLYYGIEGDSAWDTVDKLEDKGIINSQAALNLKNAITFATTLRLKTYSHHKEQKDDMSIFRRPTETESEIKEQTKQIFHLSEKDLGEQGRLFQYFYTALALHERLTKFCEQHQTLDDANKQTFFKETNFYKDDYASRGFIYIRLAQYNAAKNNLELALKNLEENWQIKHALGVIYTDFGDYDQAIEKFQDCINIENIFELPRTLNSLGEAHAKKGQYDLAIKCLEKSLELKKVTFQDTPHSEITDSLNYLGSAYYEKGDYDRAIKNYEECLKMEKLIHKEKPHPDIAGALSNIGSVYCVKGQYDQANNNFQSCLKMQELLYKNAPQRDVAGTLNNLGSVFVATGQFDQAIEYLEKSINMNNFIYKGKAHPNVAASFINLGLAHTAKEQYDLAIENHEKGQKLYKLIHKEKPHPDVADSKKSLGLIYLTKGQYDLAINCFEDSRKMNNLIHKEKPHRRVAETLYFLGLAYKAKEEYKQALVYISQALQIISVFPNDTLQNEIQNSMEKVAELINLSTTSTSSNDNIDIDVSVQAVYDVKGQNDQVKYLEKSLEKKKLIHKEKPHPDVASYLNNLGNVYFATEQYSQAIKYHEESLKIYKLIHKDKPHPNITVSLRILCIAHTAKGQYDLARNYYQDSLKMQKLICKNAPH